MCGMKLWDVLTEEAVEHPLTSRYLIVEKNGPFLPLVQSLTSLSSCPPDAQDSFKC